MKAHFTSIPSRITFATLTCMSLFAVMCLYSITKLKSLNSELVMVSHVYQPALSELTSIKTNVLNNMEYLDNVTDQLKNPYLLYGQKGLQEEIDTFQSNLNKQLVTLETTLKNADLNDADEKKFNLFFKGIQEYFILQSQIFDHLSKQRELQALKQDRDKLYLEKFKWQQNMAALISLLSDKMTSQTY